MCESVTWLWLYDVQDSQAVHAYVCKTLNFPVQHEVAQTEDRPLYMGVIDYEAT